MVNYLLNFDLRKISNKFSKYFLIFFINILKKLTETIPISFYQKINNRIAQIEGKGWGGRNTIKQEVEACLYLLNKKPIVFVDIGANKGLYTEYLLTKFPNLRSHLFEPSEINYKILTDKFLSKKNIFINKVGLSKSNSKGILYSDQFGSGLASVTKRKLDHMSIDFDQEEDINLLRFDKYWEKEELIDYVKIDVEGHELDVLKGFGDLIYKTNLIQFEFGGCNIDTRTFFQDFWYFFLKKNFIIYRITPRGCHLISNYFESDEYFNGPTNYIALNQSLN